MSDQVREVLCRLLREQGRSLLNEPRRLDGLLRDFCPHQKREVHLLVSAQREGIVDDLQGSATAAAPGAAIERLIHKLEHNLALTADAARWAVESWALALGIQARAPAATPPPRIEIAQPVVPYEDDSLHLPASSGGRPNVSPPPSPAGSYPQAASSAGYVPPHAAPTSQYANYDGVSQSPPLSVRALGVRHLLACSLLTALGFGGCALYANKIVDLGPLVLVPATFAILGPFAMLGYLIQAITGYDIFGRDKDDND